MRLIAYLLVAVLFCGMATGCVTAGSTVTSAQQVATDSLETVGLALKNVPATVDVLYDQGKITKADYNRVAILYGQAKAAYAIAVDATTIWLTTEIPGTDVIMKQKKAAFDAVYGELATLVATFQGGGS